MVPVGAKGIKIKINCDIRGAEKAMERLDEQMAKLQKAERKVGHINTNCLLYTSPSPRDPM